jgi:hypothetical protein
MRPTVSTLVVMVVLLYANTFAAASAESQPSIPAGISDLLAATPTILSPLDQRGKQNTARVGNSITILGSQIVFARSDKPTLVETIVSMIQNSGPGAVGDQQLMESILTVLEADGSDQEAKVTTQIQETLQCRAQKEKLRKCVEKLVDVAVPVGTTGKESVQLSGDEAKLHGDDK